MDGESKSATTRKSGGRKWGGIAYIYSRINRCVSYNDQHRQQHTTHIEAIKRNMHFQYGFECVDVAQRFFFYFVDPENFCVSTVCIAG